MSLIENTLQSFEIKEKMADIDNDTKTRENMGDSDESELQIDDTEQRINESLLVQNNNQNSETFGLNHSTILTLLQHSAHHSLLQDLNRTSPFSTITPSNASDDDFKSAMDLSTKRDDLYEPPSTSSGLEQHSNGGPIPRNAGRKKTHPVWNFFRDLRDSNGIGSVICLSCDWQTDDRSPNNLRTHLKRSHDNEIYTSFLLMLSQTPTQPYIKRNRGTGNVAVQNANIIKYGIPSAEAFKKDMLDGLTNNLDPSISQHLGQLFAEIMHNSQVVNNDARVNLKAVKELQNKTQESFSTYNSMSEISLENTAINESHLSMLTASLNTNKLDTNRIENNLADTLALAAAHPLTWAIVSGNTTLLDVKNTRKSAATSADPTLSNFSLTDPETLSVMLRVALDLDLTFASHGRRGQLEFCFESNRTAERSGGRGRMITLTNVGTDIIVSEKVNGQISDTETWKKTDLTQLMWALRGKCQKVLNR